MTIPLILYENQHLDSRLKTLAVSGGRPKFSASGLGRQRRRAPFELKLPKVDEESGAKQVPAWRSDVQLPLRDSPWNIPKTGSQEIPSLEGAERSHFWLYVIWSLLDYMLMLSSERSDWTLDVTHPGVDADDGWQYAQSFNDPEERWSAEPPPQLVQLLSGTGMVASLGSPSRSTGRSSSNGNSQLSWVRRRRWVRVMRRRLDIPPLPFMEPDGSMYHLAADGAMIPYVDESADDLRDGDGQELGMMQSTLLSSAQDYVARARYLVGNQSADTNGDTVSAVDARRAIAKLERATTELRQGLLSKVLLNMPKHDVFNLRQIFVGDDDMERKTQAEVLLNAYSRELERRRLAAGAQGWLISGDGKRLQIIIIFGPDILFQMKRCHSTLIMTLLMKNFTIQVLHPQGLCVPRPCVPVRLTFSIGLVSPGHRPI